ncbi:sigma 54-interacting transcriptional regulator [Flavobacterium sp. MAH-1]|uniref:Sigma 54-interacting transcriptional regulator n=1 Tax=Flavobacterium agri TaxID=2743471 RepID=A0A7Y9C486_9FLAO|nr:sigma 54-interacting response regulator [Flavobacterium agri]NUY79620.1 sigma 54-interacting transcriptional regulator [Flavobacterium agri]NYA69645.1 sigma 54-interacting transcriptional regulator [Flavobacterium agri]
MERIFKQRILIVEDQFVEAHDLKIILQKSGHDVVGTARSVSQAWEMVLNEKPDLVCLDVFLQGPETGIELAEKLREKGIGFVYISANSNAKILDAAKKTQPYGFIVKPFREVDVKTTLEIASYRHNHSIEMRLQQQRVIKEKVRQIGESFSTLPEKLTQVCHALQLSVPFDFMSVLHTGREPHVSCYLRKTATDYELFDHSRILKMSDIDIDVQRELLSSIPTPIDSALLNGTLFTAACAQNRMVRFAATAFGMRSGISVRCKAKDSGCLYIVAYSRDEDFYGEQHLEILLKISKSISELFRDDNTEIPKQVAVEKKTDTPNLGIIGGSKKMIEVFDYIRKVAPSDTSVLILGESGTGKEKVARVIHELSGRKEKQFVIVNCGTISDTLSESILFGHEKGSFTGATERHTGKFEMAQGGTIFLDEIGELPIALQVKLLRVLQEKTIERIGGNIQIPVDVRVIAATNKNLEEEVAAGRFRLDLYYRLLTFPIRIPALRERMDDIESLARHFVALYCQRHQTAVRDISADVLQEMAAYSWPGNIRELENRIYRAMLLGEGSVLKDLYFERTVPSPSNSPVLSEYVLKSMHDNERDYISFVLKQCKGKVSGVGGAAEILQLPATTLYSKIKKLGIKVNQFA